MLSFDICYTVEKPVEKPRNEMFYLFVTYAAMAHAVATWLAPVILAPYAPPHLLTLKLTLKNTT